MFINQVLFELKRISKPLVAMLFVLLLATMAVPIWHELTQPTYGRSYGGGILLPTTAKSSSKSELTKDLLLGMQYEQKRYLTRTPTSEHFSDLTKAKPLLHYNITAIKLLKQKNYQQLNQLSTDFITNHPVYSAYTPDIITLGSCMTSMSLSGELLEAQQIAIMQNAPSRLAAISVYSDATNLLMPTIIGWGLMDSHKKPLPTTMMLLAIIIIFVAQAFGTHRKNDSNALMSMAPISDTKILLARVVTLLLVLDCIIIFAYLIIAICISLIPGHDFGSLFFPIMTSKNGGFLASSVISMFWHMLTYYSMWIIMLGSCAALLIHAVKDTISLVFLLGLGTFPQLVGLTSLLPITIINFLPAGYLNLPQILLHTGEFKSMSYLSVISVFGFWSVCFWVVNTFISARK